MKDALYYDEFDGFLAVTILEKDIQFIKEIVNKLTQARHLRVSNAHNIFNYIWQMDNYEEYIKIAYQEEIKFLPFKRYIQEIIFDFRTTDNIVIKQRKRKWIEEYINSNYNDIEKIKKIFEIIEESLSKYCNSYLLQFIQLNKNIEDLKQIPLFVYSHTWHRSTIPFLDGQINFWKDIRDNINGLEYIEHKDYINSKKELCKKEKEKIRLQEYINNYLD